MADIYAILDCEDAEKWANLTDGLWRSGLNELVKWKWYKVYNGELPTDEELGSIKGMIITGSHHSVNSGDEWVNKLLEFIQNFALQTKTGGYANNNVPKLIGSCFGCQAIGKALGGEVAHNECKYFVFNYENIQLSERLKEFSFGTGFYNSHIKDEGNSQFTALESHSECVLKAPEDAIVLGSSKTSPNELFLVNNNILAIQSHPEISPPLALEKIYPSLKSTGRLVNEEEVLANLQLANDHNSVLSFLQHFLQS